MRQKQVKIQTFRQKSLKKMQIFFQIFFLKPAFQKEEKNMKKIFRSVRMLPNISKILERLWNFSSQNDSVVGEKAIAKNITFFPCLKNGNQKYFGTFLADSSEAFDCLFHKFLLTKTACIWFCLTVLKIAT